MARGEGGGRPRKHNAEPAVSIDATDDDTKTLKSEVKKRTAAYGQTKRPVTSGRKTVKRNPDDLGAGADGIKSTPAKYVAVQLPANTEHKIGDVLKPFDQEQHVYNTFLLREDEARLNNAQKVAIEMLADMIERRSIPQVADELNVSHQLVYRWLRNPVFLTSLELRKRENFLSVARIKAYNVLDKELDAKVPSSRMLEIIAKTIGFFSDSDTININLDIGASKEQQVIDSLRDSSY